MFEPEDLLDHLLLDSLSAERAIEEIWQLAVGAREGMSAQYYMQRLGAIEILTGIAARRLESDAFDSSQ